MTEGLFRVKSAKKGQLTGTAFVVDQLSSTKMYYIVTAYHVIAEIIATGDSILLEDKNGQVIPADCISSPKEMTDYIKPENDFAVLKAVTDIEYKKFRTINYSLIQTSSKCSIRGANAFFPHPFTPFTAIYEGPVKIGNGKDILLLNNLSTIFLDDPKQYISSHKLFEGSSGAPVLVNYQNEVFCIGILTQIGSTYQTPSRYVVPISYVAKDVTGINIENDTEQLPTITPSDYLNAIFSYNDDFVFSDDKEDKRIWNALSNAHFREGNIDLKLKNIILSEEFGRKNAEIKCAILYYYARLLFKRGRKEDALNALAKLQAQAPQMSQESNKKIVALVKSRKVIEAVGPHIHNPSSILKAADWLDSNIQSPEYMAYEQASLYGKGIMNLFQSVSGLNESEKKEVLCIYKNQKDLHEKYPTELKKQEVVITAVEWFIELWNASNNLCMDDIDETIKVGFSQAHYLRNNIFHIQCLLAIVVSSLIKEKKTRAVIVFVILSRLMHNLHITFKNEGISQLIKYINEKYNAFFQAFDIIHKNRSINDEVLRKLDILKINLDNSNWKMALDEGLAIYKQLYAPGLNNPEAIQPYEIEYDELTAYVW